MADIRPFPAIRPAKGKEEMIAALPYDVYSRAEAREAVKDRPLSFLRIDRAETQLPEDVDLYDGRVYEKARELFEALKERRIYVRYFPKPRIDNYLRISIGTDAEMDALLAFLGEYTGKRG